jgi:hypothetical protein
MKPEILPPLSASLHVRPLGLRHGVRLWLPLFLVWLVLLPLLILLLPLLFVAALIFGVSLWRSLKALNGFLAASRGTQVEVDKHHSKFFIQLH